MPGVSDEVTAGPTDRGHRHLSRPRAGAWRWGP